MISAAAYGKSGVRVVKVTRRPDGDLLKDVTVDVRFEGELEASFADGDNTLLIPTDTMKNTVYALARTHPIDDIERFAMVLVDHFLWNNQHLRTVTVEIEERPWSRLSATGRPHPHTFVQGGPERRTARVSGTAEHRDVHSGVKDLAAVKTSGSALVGFLKDPCTTLAETRERLLATVIEARWQYRVLDVAFSLYWQGVRQVMLQTFAEHQSESLQHTLHAMGQAVLDAYDEIAEVRLAMPNRHHAPVDLAPLGLDNPNEIFLPADEPLERIEATLRR